jgi:hypothetical protein
MGLSTRFTIRKEATPELLALLKKTVLGTNGACYQHLDTQTRIFEADNPLFVSLERDGQVQGNVTFCNRKSRWYVRYFAFSGQKQASKNVNRIAKSKSRLKNEIADFYDEVFEGNHGEAPDAFYAFIDPKNERSKWMAEQFGFRTEAQLITQSFSRKKPKVPENFKEITDQETIDKVLCEIKKTHAYFVEEHARRGPFFGLYNEENELIAFTKVTSVNWIIKRLPGMLGGLFTKLLPYTPGICKIIKPKKHQFLVPESVWVKDHDPRVLSMLFEGVLASQERNMILWWIDRRESLWRDTRNHMNWGIVHKMTPQAIVDVVVMRKNPLKLDELRNKPVFVAGWDMV